MQLKLLFCVVLETFSPERRGLMKEMKTHTHSHLLLASWAYPDVVRP